MTEQIDRTLPDPGHYPAGTQARLLETALVTAPTRAALAARAATPRKDIPGFLAAAEFVTLRAVCDRLVAQEADAPDHRVDLAGALDTRMAEGRSDGWRYDVLPPDGEALRLGLAAINETAAVLFGRGFADLSPGERDGVLRAVQEGDPPGAAWRALDARRFFEDLLAATAETFYASATAQDEIGYVGYADAHGWHAVGLGGRDGPEPEPT